MRFEVGRRYNREQDIHGPYAGQRRRGIITPAEHPMVLIVTGESGEQHGYRDRWDSAGVFHYYGEGQSGDMTFKAGNAAILNHSGAGKELHMFEHAGAGFLRYYGEMLCAGYELVQETDGDGEVREAIVFQLVPIDEPDAEPESEPDELPSSLEGLRSLAKSDPTEEAEPADAHRKVRKRSRALVNYIRARADGTCEACNQPAPFTTTAGRPYLEVHHVNRLSDGGPGRPDSAAGICPTCHRRVHHGEDGEAYNATLAAHVLTLEAT